MPMTFMAARTLGDLETNSEMTPKLCLKFPKRILFRILSDFASNFSKFSKSFSVSFELRQLCEVFRPRWPVWSVGPLVVAQVGWTNPSTSSLEPPAQHIQTVKFWKNFYSLQWNLQSANCCNSHYPIDYLRLLPFQMRFCSDLSCSLHVDGWRRWQRLSELSVFPTVCWTTPKPVMEKRLAKTF